MRSSLQFLQAMRHSSNFLQRTLAFFLCFFLFQCFHSIAQIAPVNPPTGGFHIDGNLRANTPTANAGDWLFGFGGTGGFVLNNNGTAVDPAHTGRRIDLFNSSSDSIFTQGSKFMDLITGLRWGNGKPPQKDDIHNALFHVTTNPDDGHQWVFMGGDRLSTSGTSYLDFEFLQGTITMNANGTFTGSGPDGGRTNNDLVLSMRYESGGTNTRVLIYRWSDTTHEYKLIDTSLTNAFAYAKTNLDTIAVPYGAFGNMTYAAFAFVEGAVDITQLVNLSSGANCAGLTIQTLWIKTKASASNTAALKDMFTPIPVSLVFGNIDLAAAGPFCINDSPVQLEGDPSGGTFSGNGVSSSGLFTPANAGAGTHQIIYSASVGNNCIKKDTIYIVVNPRPTVSVNSPSRCSNGPATTITATPSGTGPFTYEWTVPGGASNPGNVSSFSATVGGQYCVVVTDANGCASTSGCGTLTVNNPTTLIAGTYGPFCITASPALLGGSPSGGTWSGTGVSFVSGNYQFSPTTAGAGNFVLTYNFTNANSCTSTITANVIVNAQPAAPNVTYNAPACDETTFSVTITNVVNGATYTIKDKNGANIPGVSPGNSVVAPNTNNIIFSNIPAGSGYQVTVSISSCTSGPNLCGGESARTTAKNTEQLQVPTFDLPTQLAVKAYPNPFSDRIKFVVTSPIAGQGVLEVYNSMGQTVKTVYKGFINSGTQTFDLNLPVRQTVNLIYMLRVGDKKVSGKLLQINQ